MKPIYKVELYRSIWNGKNFRKEWRWRVKANNGKIIGSSSESYINKKDCIHNICSLGLALNNYKN